MVTLERTAVAPVESITDTVYTSPSRHVSVHKAELVKHARSNEKITNREVLEEFIL